MAISGSMPGEARRSQAGAMADHNLGADRHASVEIDDVAVARRKQPDEMAWPIVSGWLVPWMRKTVEPR
jgi:hypothetical protein